MPKQHKDVSIDLKDLNLLVPSLCRWVGLGWIVRLKKNHPYWRIKNHKPSQETTLLVDRKPQTQTRNHITGRYETTNKVLKQHF